MIRFGHLGSGAHARAQLRHVANGGVLTTVVEVGEELATHDLALAHYAAALKLT